MGICALGCGEAQRYSRYSSIQLYRPNTYMFSPVLGKIPLFTFDFNIYDNLFLQRLEKRSLLTKSSLSTLYISFLSRYDAQKLKTLIPIKHLETLKLIISFDDLKISDIKNIIRFLSLQNRLTELHIHFWRNHLLDQPKLVLLLESLGTLTSLRTLVLTFKGSDFLVRSQITDSDVQVFCKALKKLRKLRKLYLDFPLRNYVSEVGFKHLQKAIGKLFNLEEMDFKCAIVYNDVEEGNNNNNASISNSIENIGKLRNLKRLSLVIPSNPKPENNILLALSKVIRRLNQLEHLHIGVQKLEITAQEMILFLEALSQSKKLKNFSINFDLKPTFSEGKFPSFPEWAITLARLDHLTIPLFEEQEAIELSPQKDNTERSFAIKDLDLRDYSFLTPLKTNNINVPKYVQSLSNLVKLKWEIYSDKILPEFISTVQVSLGKLTALRELDITISTHEFSEKLASKFISTISECRDLRSLKIMIHSIPIKLGEVFLAFANLFSHTKGLNTFHLKLTGFVWKEVSDSDFTQFCKGLAKLEGLRDLYLNFSRPSQMLEDILFILGGTLSSCLKLESLSLILEFCHNIPDQAELSLVKNLKSLKKLKKFELNLRNPNSHRLLQKRIGDEILIVLCQGLIKSKELVDIRLNFEGNDITDLGIKTLGEAFNKLKSLKNIHLDFSQCCKITNKGIRHLKEMYAFLNQLAPLHLLEETAHEGFVLHNPSQLSPELYN